MKFVQPIRDQQKIEAVKLYLKYRNDRDYILFVLGINTGLRISDILLIKVGHVKGTHLDIIEQKTGKQKVVKINRSLRAALNDYIPGKPDNEYLFRSTYKKHKTGASDEPIDCSTAYKFLRAAAMSCDIPEIGTHSLRKTFGYHTYLNTKNVVLLMELFNHSDPSITLRYIGIHQDTLDDAVDDLNL
jgi:integrase